MGMLLRLASVGAAVCVMTSMVLGQHAAPKGHTACETPDSYVIVRLEISADGAANFGGLGFSPKYRKAFEDKLRSFKRDHPCAIVELHKQSGTPMQIARDYIAIVQKSGLRVDNSGNQTVPHRY